MLPALAAPLLAHQPATRSSGHALSAGLLPVRPAWLLAALVGSLLVLGGIRLVRQQQRPATHAAETWTLHVQHLLAPLAVATVGRFVPYLPGDADTRTTHLQAVHIAMPYRVYAATTFALSLLGAAVAMAMTALVIVSSAGGLTPVHQQVAQSLPAVLVPLGASGVVGTAVQAVGTTLMAPLVTAGLAPRTAGVVVSVLVILAVGLATARGLYWVQWRRVTLRAAQRAQAIDASLPSVIAFLFALSRKGIPMTVILETLTAQTDSYGAAADEFAIAVRHMSTYGSDLHTAIRETARRTPSQQCAEFCDNLVNVLQSGQDVGEFLEAQYDQYYEAYRREQAQLVETLGVLAETYVSVFVVGALLLVSVLAILGIFQLGETLPALRGVVYLVVPAANLGFLWYVRRTVGTAPGTRTPQASPGGATQAARSSAATPPVAYVTPPFGIRRRIVDWTARARPGRAAGDAVSDTARRTLARLAVYNRFRAVWAYLADPVGTIVHRPRRVLYLVGPIVGAWFLKRVWGAPAVKTLVTEVQAGGVVTWSPALVGAVQTLDDPVFIACWVAAAAFAVVYRVRVRQQHAVEQIVPDLLSRLANVNAAGVDLVTGLQQLRRSELGALGPQVTRAIADVSWGGDVATAFTNLAHRVQHPVVTRAMVLVTNALDASGEIAPVLSIAADDAQTRMEVRRERLETMATYVVVIYVAALVFLGIIGIVLVVLAPALPSQSVTAGAHGLPTTGGMVSLAAGGGAVNLAAYRVVLFHAAVIQCALAGLVAGALAEGTAKAGVKHAVVLTGVTYAVFLVI